MAAGCRIQSGQWPDILYRLLRGQSGDRPEHHGAALRSSPHIHFAHLRATGRDSEDKRSFHEAEHLEGDLDMVDIISVLVAEERRRLVSGGASLPMRPDHGHHILDDARRETRPGYPLYGRMKGLAEIRGLEMAVIRLAPQRLA